MHYPEIEEFLMKTIGLDPASIGSKSVERAIKARMELASLREETKYLALLQENEVEQAALIETVIVPETWFFRDQGPFDYLREYVALEWKPANKDRVFRVLSVPCSTGEEPFSIAITLIEAGLGDNDFSIDAVDISMHSLQKAKRGIYGKSSFREKDNDYIDRYFSTRERGFQVSEQILNAVHFQFGNILNPDFSANRFPYDAVFCRNLLIYMTQEAKKRILGVLDSILVHGGVFFTGHTETMLVRSFGYSIVKRPRVFACKKAERPQKVKVKEREKTKPIITVASLSVRPAPSLPAVPNAYAHPAQSVENTKATMQEGSGPLLDRIRELGDRGAIEEALVACKEALKEYTLNSEVYYLMGLLHDTSDKSDKAEECFLKALYLDPNHYPALVKLYLLYEQRGDITRAKAYRDRASRVQVQQKVSSQG